MTEYALLSRRQGEKRSTPAMDLTGVKPAQFEEPFLLSWSNQGLTTDDAAHNLEEVAERPLFVRQRDRSGLDTPRLGQPIGSSGQHHDGTDVRQQGKESRDIVPRLQVDAQEHHVPLRSKDVIQIELGGGYGDLHLKTLDVQGVCEALGDHQVALDDENLRPSRARRLRHSRALQDIVRHGVTLTVGCGLRQLSAERTRCSRPTLPPAFASRCPPVGPKCTRSFMAQSDSRTSCPHRLVTGLYGTERPSQIG